LKNASIGKSSWTFKLLYISDGGYSCPALKILDNHFNDALKFSKSFIFSLSNCNLNRVAVNEIQKVKISPNLTKNEFKIEMDDYSNGIYSFKISYDNRVEEFVVIKN
jgi:hypothetical protein